MNSLLFLRLAVAAIFIHHSVPKLKEPRATASAMGWMPGQVLALGMIEFVSALGIAGGVAVKLSALLLVIVMSGAIYHKISKWKISFTSNNATGWEFDFILLAANLTLFFRY